MKYRHLLRPRWIPRTFLFTLLYCLTMLGLFYICLHALALYTHVPPIAAAQSPSTQCDANATYLQLSDPPYENYFYSDCNSSTQVVVTSPLPDSNLTVIGPRLLIAWPAGNSGAVIFFSPSHGINGTLSISLQNLTGQQRALGTFYQPASGNESHPRVGVTGSLSLNSSARADTAILGSIRAIRDFTEGPSILVPTIQGGNKIVDDGTGGVSISRLWLDNVTTTTLSFAPDEASGGAAIAIENTTLFFKPGNYSFTASFNYPQLDQLSPQQVLNNASQTLIDQYTEQADSLAFLSYTDKLLAGAWRFLTYFGRDSMISLLLLQPILSEGEGGAIEAVIGAVLERINRTDGSVCHEETIGDYATYLNLQQNIWSTAPQYDYKMIDTDFFLPIIMYEYFVRRDVGRERQEAFFSTQATVDPANEGLDYGALALVSAEKIVNITSAFAVRGGQVKENLIHLKEGQVVGQWRDSTYGIGGGRIPYDVNTALVPAALRAIAGLSVAGFFPEHIEWADTASQYAQVWEDETLHFFEVDIAAEEAQALVRSYIDESGFAGPASVDSITADIRFHGLALEGNNNQPIIKVMNTDDCFRLFLVNSTNQTQLTLFLDQSADNILRPFPIGLSTSIGVLVANPAYGGDPVYAANFTNNAYHGTVVWSWQLAMLAAGLERQLDRCNTLIAHAPDFCFDTSVYSKVRRAYNHLWDLIDANSAFLSSEVWSWVYSGGDFVYTPLGALPPPAGQSPTGEGPLIY
ncbi:glycogen debranching enzyme [Macrophomina phaseolina MS6]|uniref:Glycogen debranching enzyme n=1 Tax=Macrophomina phaseolina (strain MS6) TaxID=1126212 RepID=K2RWW9_MACPH|nr:glycogen debranching enzyme [Macrophomina phaseolina MS6]